MSKFDIEYLEELSKLNFSDSEKKIFESDFERILNFVDEITQIEMPNEIERTCGVALSSLREDVVDESRQQCDVLSNAPEQMDGCYLTPMVVE